MLGLAPEMLGLAAAAVLGPLVCEWLVYPSLARFFKDGAAPAPEADYEELSRRYAKWALAGLVAYLAFTAAATALWALPFQWLLRAHADALAAASVALVIPSDVVIALPSLAAGMLWAFLPMPLFYRLILRERYPEWRRYEQIEMQRLAGVPVDIARAVRSLVTAGSAIALAFLMLGLDCYTRFTRSEIAINRYWGFGESRRGYDEVSTVTLRAGLRAPNGDWVRRPHLALEFRDGTMWRSIDMPWESAGTYDRGMTDERLGGLVAGLAGLALRDERTKR